MRRRKGVGAEHSRASGGPGGELASLYASPPADEPAWPDRFGRLLSEWAEACPAGHVQTLSLFTGGGLDIGFRDAGFRIHTMVEMDPACVATLKVNTKAGGYRGEVDVRPDDVRGFKLPVGRKVRFVIGCPPCQSFSAASRRVNGVNGISDKRGTLFEAYIRLLRELSPEAFLFENVAGITGAQEGTAWPGIVAAFREAGFQVFHRVLDAADFGVPQHRERMFLVGVRGDVEYRFPAPTHGPDSAGGTPFYLPRQAVEGVVLTRAEWDARLGTRYGHLLADIPPGLNYSFFTERMGHPRPLFAWRSKFSDFLYKADPDRPVRTLKADGGGCTGPFHWDNRLFAVSELKRLQTIPDNYALTGGRGSLLAQIGNAVPCQLARLLALSVLSQVFGVELPFEMRLLDPDCQLGFRRRQRDLTEVYCKKAAEAIARLRPGRGEDQLGPRFYRARLTEKLGWAESGAGPLAVRLTIRDYLWRVHVSKGQVRRHAFKISVEPSAGEIWPLSLGGVSLTGNELTPEVFTGTWKAFEAELSRLDVRADLVQLCGYYGYRPAMTCEMWASSIPSPSWKAVIRVVGGQGVSKVLPESDLASAWGIGRKQVLPAARFLKRLGYEVRSNKTNARIPNGYLLVPYPFPTLNPKSIQLYKEL
jgi:DNA (cytosine-5)-methyltransferase 1